MKKNIFLLFCISALLVSCGSQNVDIDAAKKQLLSEESSQESVQETVVEAPAESVDTTVAEPEPQVSEPKIIQIQSLSKEQFVEINPINEDINRDGSVEITGATLTEVDKIEVSFTNDDSVFPDDRYTLQTFKKWDDAFKYIASSKFQVLDFGTNLYTVTAHKGDATSETQITIELQDPEATKVEFETSIIGTEELSLEIDLPKSAEFGDPVSLGATSFTYSNIDTLEVSQRGAEVSCDTLTEFLTEDIDTWFFWNTCRDIIKDKGISFNVITLGEDDSYIYTRHYVDFAHGLYGTYQVDTGTGVTKENISDKNTELKEQADSFESIAVVDRLMRAIVSQD